MSQEELTAALLSLLYSTMRVSGELELNLTNDDGECLIHIDRLT